MMRLGSLGWTIVLAATPFGARAETVLRLAETATVLVQPDELSASLRAEATAGTAAEAQSRVNAAIAAAILRVKAVPAVAVATGGYNVWHVAPTPQDRTDRWQAGQSLELKSHDAAALLALTGQLQSAGMATARLSWGLSPDAVTQARAEATRQALTALRGRAEAAAALIGLSFDSFREMRLDSVRPQPMPARMMAAAKMADAAPPSAEAEDIPIAATAEAAVLLKPR